MPTRFDGIGGSSPDSRTGDLLSMVGLRGLGQGAAGSGVSRSGRSIRYPGESARIFRVSGGIVPRVLALSALATDRGGCANRVARTVGVEVSASRKNEAAPIPQSLQAAAIHGKK